MITIETSTDEDLVEILTWLKVELEADEYGRGFFHNRSLIEQAHEKGELLVIRENSHAAAFHFGGLVDSGILEVRPDCRGRGYGRALVEHSIEVARRSDVNVLHVTCSPESSVPFWQRMGFTEIPSAGGSHDPVYAYRILHKKHALPEGRPADVEIVYYGESALYDRSKPHEPVARYAPGAVYLKDGSIMLAERAIGYQFWRVHIDLVVKVIVDGKELCFGKAKHEEAQALGIRMGETGLFYADRLFLRALQEQ